MHENFSSMISVVIATYNGKAYIEAQINSILEQTYAPRQIFIRDDGSSDGTLEYIQEIEKKFPHLVTLLPASGNRGVIENFSLLANKVQTPFTAFCDQDDLWHRDKLEKLVKTLEKGELEHSSNTPLLVHSDLKVVDGNLKELYPSFLKFLELEGKKKDFSTQLIQNRVTGCAMAVNQALLKLALPFPPTILMHDHWCALVAAAFGKILFINEPLLSYRQHGNNCVGADNNRFIFRLRRLLRECIKKNSLSPLRLQKEYNQTLAFENRFKELLSKEQKKILSAWKDILLAPAVFRLFPMAKNHLFKEGLSKNIKFLCRWPAQKTF